ncbi:MAG: FAD-binding oxidoreductase [Planctomycetota bacterium]
MADFQDRRTFIHVSLMASLGYVLVGCESQNSSKPARTNTSTPSDPRSSVTLDGLIVFRKGDERYDSLRGGFNQRIQKYPAIVVLARNTDEVATAIRHARRERLPVAVRSGGHSFEGFSSNNDGMIVDVSLMDSFEWLSSDEQTIKVGPGLRLATLYSHLLQKNRMLPAGSCASVGIGGLTLGGGYGLFSRQWGLTCDSLISLTLVDGNGNLRNTDDDPELLWACRGGGNGNFGAVVSLTFKIHTAPTGLYSHRFKAYKLDSARAAKLLKLWCEIEPTLPKTTFSAFVLNGRTLTILVTDTENTYANLQSALKVLEKHTDKTTLGTKQDLPKALSRYYGIDHPLLFKNASAGFYSGYGDIADVFPQIAETVATHRGMIFQVNTLGGAVANSESEKVSAFAHRGQPFLAELQAYYDRPSQEEKLLSGFQHVQKLLSKAGVSRHYRNYPDINFKNWESDYYGDNYSRLQAVKQRTDPNGRFTYAQGIRP